MIGELIYFDINVNIEMYVNRDCTLQSSSHMTSHIWEFKRLCLVKAVVSWNDILCKGCHRQLGLGVSGPLFFNFKLYWEVPIDPPQLSTLL